MHHAQSNPAVVLAFGARGRPAPAHGRGDPTAGNSLPGTQTTGKGGKTTKRLMLMVYVVAAVVAVLYPTLSEARLSGNHNETLVRDPR